MTALSVSNKSFDYTGKTIVDCPCCGTRFCVKNEVLQKYSSPNFHCSRCDNVFSLDANTINNVQQSQSSNFAQSTMSAFAARPISSENKTTSSINNGNKSFNIPKVVSAQFSQSAPHETAINENPIFTTSPESALFTEPPGSKEQNGRRILKAIDILRHIKFSAKKEPEETFKEAITQPLQTASGKWQDLLSISTPILIFLLSLSLVSFYFVQNPSIASSVISAIVPSASKMSPDGLHIMETEFSKITLDNGEEVTLISGEIQNKSQQGFGSIQLEAQAFDREGTLIKKALSTSGAALVDTRIKSLSPKMIESLQSAKGQKRLTVAPNKAEKFTVALVGDEMDHAAYFSIRIYSVRAKS
ncbi:MAG: hypothetical protein SGJ02_07165 [bacterium]|nr:hypothetical protein [bacterium]